MPASIRVSGLCLRVAVSTAALLAFAGFQPSATAQTSTAPQLLPYMTRIVSGTGATAHAPGSVCTPAAGSAASGYTSYDPWGSGCLGPEVQLLNPKDMITDASGAIYFTDYTTAANGSLVANTGVVHRLDPNSGVVTTIAGGGKTLAAGAACGTPDTRTAKAGDVFGDGCLATSVLLQRPSGITLSADGNTLYIADNYAYNVRSVALNNGGVAAVAVVNGGAGYATAPTVTFVPAAGNVPTSAATGVATINASGAVTGVTITNSGSGYTAAPTVTFSVPGTGTNAATGQVAFAGVISMAVGSNNGTSASAYGFSAQTGCSLAAMASAGATVACTLRAVYNVAVDANGLIYLPEEYYDALLIANPTATAQTVLGTAVPAGTMQYVAGYKSGGCLNGNASSSGCTFGTYISGSNALSANGELDNSYTVALDSYKNAYITDDYYGNLAQISAGTNLINGGAPGYVNGALTSAPPVAGILSSYAGSPPAAASHTYGTPAATTRGIATTFNIGSNFGVGLDLTNNTYITDSTNGLVWRVDAATQTMFVVAGVGSSAPSYTVGAACSNVPANVSAKATDAAGDGCPATSAIFGATTAGKFAANLFIPSADAGSNLYVPDTTNVTYREVATGANFGNTGASATDYIDVHFQAGDAPAATAPFSITAGSATFTLGAASCHTNADSNANFGNSTDCVVPIIATPLVSGPYAGTLTVFSRNSPAGVTYALRGNFAQSPVTRTTLTAASSAAIAAGCTGTTYTASAPVTLTATVVSNGPVAPTGNIVFTNNGVSIGTVGVTNIGTATAPVYGAVLNPTLPAGPQNVVATFNYTAPTMGQVYTYVGSTSLAATFVTASPSFAISLTPTPLNTIKAGGQALYSFNIANTVYTGTITFACSNLPAGASCIFSPATISGAGCTVTNTVALNINTTGPTYSMPAGMGGTGSNPWSLAAMLAAAVLAAALGAFRRRIPARATQLMLALAFLLGASGLVACSKASGTLLTTGTPVGTYNTITVTATGSNGTTSSTPISLTVN